MSEETSRRMWDRPLNGAISPPLGYGSRGPVDAIFLNRGRLAVVDSHDG
jgi:hypothetical protein